MGAAKFFDDHYLDNAHYAAVGGVPRLEVNVLELEFLFLLEFNLHVTETDYYQYHEALRQKSSQTPSEVPLLPPPPPLPHTPPEDCAMLKAAPPDKTGGAAAGDATMAPSMMY